jgi:hypothetical protein
LLSLFRFSFLLFFCSLPILCLRFPFPSFFVHSFFLPIYSLHFLFPSLIHLPGTSHKTELAPIHISVGYSNYPITRYLLRKGANPNEEKKLVSNKSIKVTTYPMFQIIWDEISYVQTKKIISVLVRYGADVNTKNKHVEGSSPFFFFPSFPFPLLFSFPFSP